ncbi:ROK family protein [Flavihumibacter profundi]|uniref:ROK family protein n=1 Tax=Flavihumibacter profundi TaxID=2716883 RepID=UPI001CC3CC15|nr:ROK family protein [Flavihumibacter profundi]MBZ5858885.1 ROK family protein [Flavihumibacter profundi]
MADSPKDIIYKRAVLKQLYFTNVMSCAEISTKINKSIPLTTRIIEELIEEEYIKEVGFAPSSGGRKPMMYSLRENIMYVLSVAMDQLVTRISLVANQNHYFGEIERFDLTLHNNPDALPLLAEKIEEVIRKSAVDKTRIIGIGIGMPGFIDFKKGLNYSFLEIKDKTITQYLSEKINLPVYIDNDSSLIALGELKFGNARNKMDAMVINISWGVGLGLILNGELYRGHNGFAGEFSHMPLFNNNKLCSCGKTGCLETETSLLVLIEKVNEGIKAGRISVLGKAFNANDPEKAYTDIINAALKGDQFAIELLSDAGYNIGRGIAILVHLLNPEAIILSGRGSIAGKFWMTPIQQALNEHCIPILSENLEITISPLGYDAKLIGAATLVMDHFDEPNINQNALNKNQGLPVLQ